ncbi:hypothetical protein Poly41_39970 [Novipirellula artificiosorum]|uniref:Uncharacterized protein n=1 Tax=Novipirellula artificiosorum TaxID=2528016 RepID=A0A5C6DFV5_9BACT|nr:hypothetical protein Poly41_39970 [Novipirellula artificiosorum]
MFRFFDLEPLIPDQSSEQRSNVKHERNWGCSIIPLPSKLAH